MSPGFLSHTRSIWVDDSVSCQQEPVKIPPGVRAGQAAHWLLENICRDAQETTMAKWQDVTAIAMGMYEEYTEASISEEAAHPDYISPLQKRLNTIQIPPPPKALLQDDNGNDGTGSDGQSVNTSPSMAVGKTEKVRRQKEYIEKLSKPRRSTIEIVNESVKKKLSKLHKGQGESQQQDNMQQGTADEEHFHALASSITVPRYAQDVKRSYSRAVLKQVTPTKKKIPLPTRKNNSICIEEEDDVDAEEEEEEEEEEDHEEDENEMSQLLASSIIENSSDILSTPTTAFKRNSNNDEFTSTIGRHQLQFWTSRANVGFMGAQFKTKSSSTTKSPKAVKLPFIAAATTPVTHNSTTKNNAAELTGKQRLLKKSHYNEKMVRNFEKNWKHKRANFHAEKEKRFHELMKQHERGTEVVQKRERQRNKKYEKIYKPHHQDTRDEWNGYQLHMETEDEAKGRKLLLSSVIKEQEHQQKLKCLAKNDPKSAHDNLSMGDIQLTFARGHPHHQSTHDETQHDEHDEHMNATDTASKKKRKFNAYMYLPLHPKNKSKFAHVYKEYQQRYTLVTGGGDGHDLSQQQEEEQGEGQGEEGEEATHSKRPLTTDTTNTIITDPDKITAILSREQHILQELIRSTFSCLDRYKSGQLAFPLYHLLVSHICMQYNIPVPTKQDSLATFKDLCYQSGKKAVTLHQVRTEIRALLEFHRLVLMDTQTREDQFEDQNDAYSESGFSSDSSSSTGSSTAFPERKKTNNINTNESRRGSSAASRSSISTGSAPPSSHHTGNESSSLSGSAFSSSEEGYSSSSYSSSDTDDD